MDIPISWNLMFINKYSWLIKKKVKAVAKNLFICRDLSVNVEATEYK